MTLEDPHHAPDTQAAAIAPPALAGTKLKIAEAALETLKRRGFSGASAREIAAEGDFNQALIFYHFGNVQKALLAALDLVSARRMQAYAPSVEAAQTLPELAQLARRIHTEDLENGYVSVLGEMVAGGVTDAELGIEIAARLQPWMDMAAHKLHTLLEGSPLESMLPVPELAFAIVALYLGADMLGHLQGEHTQAQTLLDLGERWAPLLGALLPSKEQPR